MTADPDAPHLVVMAKEPVPGRVKTRLCPPCTPGQAAAIAEAALAQTLSVVAHTAAELGAGCTLALEGSPGTWLPAGVDVIAQSGGGLDERLTAVFAHRFRHAPRTPVLLVGMDTPQVTSEHLRAAASLLRDHDAVVGPAPDGGYWLIGLRHLTPHAITGVPMSTDDTGARQLERLAACGYRVATTTSLVDVDHMDDAVAVADALPGSRFADAVAAVLAVATTA